MDRLDIGNLSELRAIPSPSDGSLAAMRAMTLLLAPRNKPLPSGDLLSWKEMRKSLVKPEVLLGTMGRFNAKTDPTVHVVATVREQYLGLLYPESKDSIATEAIKSWVVGVS